MAVTINTSGISANSWITLDEANIILTEVHHPDIPPEYQLETDDVPKLIEAARSISSLFAFKGERADPLQKLAWPRRNVTLPGAGFSGSWADWPASSYSDWDPALAYHINYVSPGYLGNVAYPADQIPDEVKEAQAILAALFVQGVTVWEDNKGDNTEVQLGSLKVDNVNAVSRIMIVRQRLARWGTWVGTHISAPGGARV